MKNILIINPAQIELMNLKIGSFSEDFVLNV